MGRRSRGRTDDLSQALTKVGRRCEGTPLACVGEQLQEVIASCQKDLQLGYVAQEEASRLAAHATGVLEQLPQTFGDRFRLDAGIIAALAEAWSSRVKLSGMIMPTPSKEWGHLTIPLAGYGNQAVHVIDLILVPGDDCLQDVDLLAYPFLCHELGHNALFKNDLSFSSSFSGEVERVTNLILRQSFADKGAAKSHAQQMVAEMRQLWNPTPDHYNWAHEIAVDVIALWTCGPAFLAAFQDFLQDHDPNPHQIGQSHPPYAVRAAALTEASERLGWHVHLAGLQAMQGSWHDSKWQRERTNRYSALANAELVHACVTAAITECEALVLPRCTADEINRIEAQVRLGEVPDLGSDLLIAAWQVWRTASETEYDKWESQVLRELSAAITL